MAQELISRCPEVPAPLIDPVKVGTIRSIIDKNRGSITSLLVLAPSIIIPAHYDWRHPVIGMILGGLSIAGMAVFCAEQMANAAVDEIERLKSQDKQE